jgi:hypothetical protein
MSVDVTLMPLSLQAKSILALLPVRGPQSVTGAGHAVSLSLLARLHKVDELAVAFGQALSVLPFTTYVEPSWTRWCSEWTCGRDERLHS